MPSINCRIASIPTDPECRLAWTPGPFAVFDDDDVRALVVTADRFDLVVKQFKELSECSLELGTTHGVKESEAWVGRKHVI